MRMPPLTRNVFALYAIQLAQVLLPLVSIPYLTRVLQPEAFGQYAFAQALAQYFVLVVTYSTAWSAVRYVARQAHHSVRLRYVVSLTFFSQLYLLLGCAVVFALLNALVAKLMLAAPINWGAFVAVLGYAVFPVWLFQGLEEMRVPAALLVVARLISLLLLFALVRGPEDTAIATLLVALPPLVAGVLSWQLLSKKLGGGLIWVGWQRIHRYLRTEFQVFMSRASMSLFTAAAPVALGFVGTQQQVAYFALSDKIHAASLNSYLPLSQAAYPRLCRLYRSDPEQAAALLRTMALLMVGAGLLTTVALVSLSQHIILFVAGPAYLEAWPIMAALGCMPLLKSITNLFGIQILIPLGQERAVTRILWLAGVCNITALVPVCLLWGAFGAALLAIATELLNLVLMAAAIARYQLLTRIGMTPLRVAIRPQA
jgi:polysaccharide transporter, PST family